MTLLHTEGESDSSPLTIVAPPPLNRRAAVLEACGVDVRFGPLHAVRDVSFSLSPGELLGLIGPNGAGKTTLLRAVCGLQPLTSGVVRILGAPLAPGRSDLFSHVGFTPDTPPVYENLTVRKFLRFVGRGYQLSNAECDERTDFWLEKVWLKDKADSKIKGLSRGMRQRIGLARTLISNPTVIVLDEPAAGLDPAGRVQFRQLLIDLRTQGKALIVSSHILADMGDYCTHAGIMTGGRMIKFGTVAEVTGMHSTDRCRYTLKLTRAVPQLPEKFGRLPDLAGLVVDQTRISFEYLSDPDAAAELLAKLVELRLPICSFTADAADLEQAYLRVGIRQVE
jgi:ABC-2 type transport system ATP-binding protein